MAQRVHALSIHTEVVVAKTGGGPQVDPVGLPQQLEIIGVDTPGATDLGTQVVPSTVDNHRPRLRADRVAHRGPDIRTVGPQDQVAHRPLLNLSLRTHAARCRRTRLQAAFGGQPDAVFADRGAATEPECPEQSKRPDRQPPPCHQIVKFAH